MSTVNRPSTWWNGPVEVPQKEQCGPTPRLLLELMFDEDSRASSGRTATPATSAAPPGRSLAEHVAELARGDRVIVYGTLRQRSWETDAGERRSVVEVQAEDVGPSLRWASAKPERTSAKANASKGGQFSDEPPF